LGKINIAGKNLASFFVVLQLFGDFLLIFC
jgi:hypothetical protein